MLETSLLISLLDKFGGMGVGVVLGLMMYKLCDKHLAALTEKLEILALRLQESHNRQSALQNQTLKALERLEHRL